MEDESASLDGKGILNMRVVDLKLELEKRGLSKSGTKKDLVKRLKQQVEFEKLCEERKSGDFPSKLELDAEIQQNEFVQQYLAQQQKRYAERQEEKRLELEAVQTGHEEGSTMTSEHQSEGDENTSSDVDDKNNEKQNLSNNPSGNESQNENTDDTNVISLKSSKSDIKVLHISENETETEISDENIPSKNPVISICDTDIKNTCENTQTNETNGNENIQNLHNIPESEDTKLSISECLSETDIKSLPTEHNTETDNPVCITDSIDGSKKQKYFEVSNQSSDEKISNVAIGTGNKLSESGKCQSNSSLTHEEVRDSVSYSVSPERASSESLPKQKSPEDMEVSADCSSVPYSLSDIQLPESPDSHVKSKDSKSEERNQVDHVSDKLAKEHSHLDSKNKSNGEAVHKSNVQEDDVSESETKDSSFSNDSPEKIKMTKNKRHSEDSSDSESDRNSSPYKKKSFKDEDTSSNLAADSDNDHSKDTPNKEQKHVKAQHNSTESENEKSSDSEKSERHVDSKRKTRDKSSDSEKYNRHLDSKRKSCDNEKKLDSDKHNRHVDSKRKSRDNEISMDFDKHNRYIDSKRKSRDNEKSSDSEKHNRHVDSKHKSHDNEESSDSEKYNSHIDLKHKSHVKRRKRGSRTSPSSSSRSSDSSSERKQSKKTSPEKIKDFAQDNEKNQMSDKSSNEKSIKHKKNDSATESSTDTTVSIKKRLKIKRDNVPIEIPSSKKESLSPTKETSTTNKNIEKNSSFHSASDDKPLKQESIEEKEEENLEVNYKPRKVVLSNCKLNRRSSEDNSIEPRSKKNKWESFASAQKSSHIYSISTDSIRNWFPDFKLVSETSMEVEQDEHSLSAIDEKNGDAPPGESLNEDESNLKQESSSQMDMEDSVSQEPNFDDTTELGPVSKIIFIQNLVRPFTLNQLKDLLKQSGKIVEEYFWIDKIKSKCFVMYETEKEAIKARNSLNNTRWPSSNPKILSVEFSNIEELEKHQKGNESQPSKPPEPPANESTDTLEARVSHTVEEHKRKDRERRKEKDRSKLQAPIREWDKDKIVQDSPERERPPKEEKPRSAERKEKKESKKRAPEDTPAKLLDDLFQKTKSVPCIYWLPLTEEQAKAKEEEKKTRRLEREKRNQQLKEQEEAERRSRRARSGSRRREKENRKSSTRSRSPVSRRR